MCELVPSIPSPSEISGDAGTVWEFPEGTNVNGFQAQDGYVLQCWHPENEEWSTMLLPVEGMAWNLSPGSKLRIVESEGAPVPAPSMLEQVEANA